MTKRVSNSRECRHRGPMARQQPKIGRFGHLIDEEVMLGKPRPVPIAEAMKKFNAAEATSKRNTSSNRGS